MEEWSGGDVSGCGHKNKCAIELKVEMAQREVFWSVWKLREKKSAFVSKIARIMQTKEV